MGTGKGKGYSVNFPLRDGMDDEAFEHVFRPVIAQIMEFYRPEAVLMQCGADSLCGDRLGCFNLTLKGARVSLRWSPDAAQPPRGTSARQATRPRSSTSSPLAFPCSSSAAAATQ